MEWEGGREAPFCRLWLRRPIGSDFGKKGRPAIYFSKEDVPVDAVCLKMLVFCGVREMPAVD